MADADNNISAARRPTPTMNTSTERWNHKLQFPLVEFSIPLVFLQRVWGAAGNASGDIASMNNSNSAAIVASFADGKCQRHWIWLIWYWCASGLPLEGWKGLGSGYYGEWRWRGREIGCTLISFPISLTTSWLTPTSLPLLVGDIYMNYWGWGAALSAYTAVIILSTRGVPGRGGDQRERAQFERPRGDYEGYDAYQQHNNQHWWYMDRVCELGVAVSNAIRWNMMKCYLSDAENRPDNSSIDRTHLRRKI